MSEKIKPRVCPACGTTLGFATGIDGAVTPEAGDISFCANCFECSEFTADGYSLMTSEKMAALDEDNRNRLLTIQQKLLEMAYSRQLDDMLKRAKAWLAANAGQPARIQYNFPSTTAVIAPISLAIEKKFVVTDAAGLALIKALWPWEDRREPTVLMVRVVLDAAFGQHNRPRSGDISGESGATGRDFPPRK